MDARMSTTAAGGTSTVARPPPEDEEDRDAEAEDEDEEPTTNERKLAHPNFSHNQRAENTACDEGCSTLNEDEAAESAAEVGRSIPCDMTVVVGLLSLAASAAVESSMTLRFSERVWEPSSMSWFQTAEPRTPSNTDEWPSTAREPEPDPEAAADKELTRNAEPGKAELSSDINGDRFEMRRPLLCSSWMLSLAATTPPPPDATTMLT